MEGESQSRQVVLGDKRVPEGTSIIFRGLYAVSDTTTIILLKPQYLSGAVSQADRMGPELVCGH